MIFWLGGACYECPARHRGICGAPRVRVILVTNGQCLCVYGQDGICNMPRRTCLAGGDRYPLRLFGGRITTDAQSKLAARYGDPDVSLLSPWNATVDQLLHHRSVRAFSSETLPVCTLETWSPRRSLPPRPQTSRSGASLQFRMLIAKID